MKFHITIDNKAEGPLTIEQITKMFENGKVSKNTLCWNKTFDGWKKIGDTNEINQHLEKENATEKDQPIVDLNADDQEESVSVAEDSEVGIVKRVRRELFSNPFTSIIDYFKRLWCYVNLTFLQLRNPIFSIGVTSDSEENNEPQKRKIVDFVFFILNPLGPTGSPKIMKYDKGCYAFAKESISLLIFTILLNMAFVEINGGKTEGNLGVAFLNLLILLVFFTSVLAYAMMAKFLTRKLQDKKNARKIQESFVYQSTASFGIVMILLFCNAFGFIEIGSEFVILTVLFLLPVHQFYFLSLLNKNFNLTKIMGTVGAGFLLAVIALSTYLFSWGIASVTVVEGEVSEMGEYDVE